MNILHILPALEAGGVETGTIDLALSLTRLGQKVVVISNGGRLVWDLTNNGILHVKLPVHRKSPSLFLLVPQVASIIRSQKIDIVHASSRVPAWIGFLACKLTKTTFVTSCHGFYSRVFSSNVMGWGKLVMVISRSIEKRMREAFGVPEEKIRLVYRGVNLAKYPYDADKYNKEKDRFTIINIGRLTPIKGQYEFIKAMKHVVDKIRRVEAWIVGDNRQGREHYLEKLVNLVKELGIESHVKFLGTRADIQNLVGKADCLVLSSNVPEGFGRSIIEAGARGTACCASNIGGIKEIIDDGVSGLLFPPKDDVKMADAIVKMLSDATFSKKCARNLRKKVEEHFTLDKMTRATLSVYEEALQKSRQS
ncbi:MAG: glycosyltransferase family 4 protein [Candidatus Omnitrophica bacterium]|nr:glycosyltransferase family 4 protein [Candidatus Omnitrophota bacterium]